MANFIYDERVDAFVSAEQYYHDDDVEYEPEDDYPPFFEEDDDYDASYYFGWDFQEIRAPLMRGNNLDLIGLIIV